MGEVPPGDPAGGVADAVERQQPDAHEDPRDGREQQQHARDHEALDDHEPVEDLVDVAQRDRHDGDLAVPVARGHDAIARLVAVAPLHRLRVVDRELGGDRGLGRHVLPVVEDDLAEHLAVGVAELPVGAGGQSDAGAAAARRAAQARRAVGEGVVADAAKGQRALDGRRAGARRLVGVVEQEGALLGVGDRGEQQQPDRGHREHGQDQPRAQRGHHVRGVRSA